LHEAQALTFERQLASMPAFWQAMSPMLRERFGNQPAFDPINLWRLIHHVRPGLVRVQADALSYPLHIVLRHRIECALVNGDIEVEDVPVLWAEQVKQLLGLNPSETFIEGPLQDMHWVQGMFGYFPSYLLGAMAAAQLMQAVKRDTPNLEELVRSGNWHCVADWLRPRVWEQGARRDLDEALRYATGEPLSEDALRRQLSAWGSFDG
jgi:carboxypeptidase Taq